MKKTNLLCLTLLLVALSGLLAFPRAAQMQATGPELPRVLLDTAYVPPTGATINVAAGGDFQAALNGANPGDTIVLQAGATYTTPPDGFVLPNKPGAAWIVVRTSTLGVLPAEGSRVLPANAAAMPKLATSGLWPVVKTAAAAHHYRFIGVEFMIAPAQPQNYGIVTLGDGSTAQNSLDQVPHDLILDRCYIHGNSSVNVSRGVALNSARTAVIDSYIADCHGVGYDTQAIAGWNGPGPFKIVNNYLEGAAENFMLGGSPPAIANLIPSDIEFRRNTCYKPLSWKPGDPSYAGAQWSIKNIFELKNAQRLLIDGNTFENIWVSGQSGFAIQWTPRGESGQTPWAVVQDITFRNNIVRHAAAAINLLGYDDGGPSQQTRRVRIANNLFDDIGGAQWGGNGRFLQILDGTADVAVEHNTVFHTAQVIITEGRAQTDFVYRNNLSRHNDAGVVGTGTGTGFSTLNAYFPGYVFAGNLLAGGLAQSYPGGNFFPASLNDVGFVDLIGGNYRLLPTSPYKSAGTDGKDLGADIDAIVTAMAGGVSCASITQTSKSVAANGGADTIAVAAPDGCAWTATSNDGFISITAGASGIGNNAVSYSVAANAGAARSGTITVAGQTFTVYQGMAFSDVPANHLFYDFIGKLSARGITQGCGSGSFCPDAPVTREQMAAFIIRARGEFNPPTPTSQRFTDVPPTNPFYAFIDRMAALGITSGCGGGNYCPSANVTREQMAAFIIRALGEFNPPTPASQRFNDVPSSNSFYAFIDRMAALQITSGCGSGNYCPSQPVTRGQMAAFLVRAFGL
jgi:S-layer homology domain